MRLDDPEFIAHPYPTFATMRAQAALQWDEDLQMFIALSRASAGAVLRSRSLGRIWEDFLPAAAYPALNLIHRHGLLEIESPEYTRLRRLVAAAFARGHVERLRPRVAAFAAALADDLADAGADGSPVDLLPSYAEPLPVAVIGELLGVQRSDRQLLRPWSNAIVKMYEYGRSSETERAAETAASEFAEYLRESSRPRGAVTAATI